MRSAMLQRSCSCGGKCGSCRDTAPLSVQRVIDSPGHPIEPRTREHMESRFGHDFSSVRLHTDAAAGQSARDVSARAYTAGNHIAFAPGNFGQRLLAHELTHTIQQQNGGAALAGSLAVGSAASPAEAEAERVADRVAAGGEAGPIGAATSQLSRAPEEEPQLEQQPAKPPPKTGKVLKGNAHDECGRKSNTRVAGFDNTTAGPHISAISVDIKTNAHSPVTLTWMNVPPGVTVPSTLNGSPGAGKCKMSRKDLGRNADVDCSDPTWSNTKDSLCTPIGDHVVEGYSCQLSKKATRVTWFQKRRAIAFHNYDPVPAHPASHGCVRIDEGKADWIYDNTIPGVTTVSIKRAPGDPGPRCYGKDDKLKDRPGYVAPQPPTGAAPQQGTTLSDQWTFDGEDGP
jgi:hypothetical protein